MEKDTDSLKSKFFISCDMCLSSSSTCTECKVKLCEEHLSKNLSKESYLCVICSKNATKMCSECSLNKIIYYCDNHSSMNHSDDSSNHKVVCVSHGFALPNCIVQKEPFTEKSETLNFLGQKRFQPQQIPEFTETKDNVNCTSFDELIESVRKAFYKNLAEEGKTNTTLPNSNTEYFKGFRDSSFDFQVFFHDYLTKSSCLNDLLRRYNKTEDYYYQDLNNAISDGLNYMVSFHDKKTYLSTLGTPGNGKTRYCIELYNQIISKKLIHNNRLLFPVYITFNGTTSYPNKNENWSSDEPFINRLIYEILILEDKKSIQTFSNFCRKVKFDNTLLEIFSMIISFINKYFDAKSSLESNLDTNTTKKDNIISTKVIENNNIDCKKKKIESNCNRFRIVLFIDEFKSVTHHTSCSNSVIFQSFKSAYETNKDILRVVITGLDCFENVTLDNDSTNSLHSYIKWIILNPLEINYEEIRRIKAMTTFNSLNEADIAKIVAICCGHPRTTFNLLELYNINMPTILSDYLDNLGFFSCDFKKAADDLDFRTFADVFYTAFDSRKIIDYNDSRVKPLFLKFYIIATINEEVENGKIKRSLSNVRVPLVDLYNFLRRITNNYNNKNNDNLSHKLTYLLNSMRSLISSIGSYSESREFEKYNCYWLASKILFFQLYFTLNTEITNSYFYFDILNFNIVDNISLKIDIDKIIKIYNNTPIVLKWHKNSSHLEDKYVIAKDTIYIILGKSDQVGYDYAIAFDDKVSFNECRTTLTIDQDIHTLTDAKNKLTLILEENIEKKEIKFVDEDEVTKFNLLYKDQLFSWNKINFQFITNLSSKHNENLINLIKKIKEERKNETNKGTRIFDIKNSKMDKDLVIKVKDFSERENLSYVFQNYIPIPKSETNDKKQTNPASLLTLGKLTSDKNYKLQKPVNCKFKEDLENLYGISFTKPLEYFYYLDLINIENNVRKRIDELINKEKTQNNNINK